MDRTFRENLRDELNYQDISIKELSSITGISKRTLENYVSNKETIPPADYAYKIAKALNVSVEYLITGETPQLENVPAKFKKIIENLKKCDDLDTQGIIALVEKLSKRE